MEHGAWHGHDLDQLRRIPLVSFDGAPFVGMASRDGFGAPAQTITTTRSPRDRPSPRLVDAKWWRMRVLSAPRTDSRHRSPSMTLRSAGGIHVAKPCQGWGAEAFAQMLHMASARW